MFSVLYVYEPGKIEQLGVYKTEEEADEAARQAQRDGVVAVEFQHVYLMRPDHKLVEYLYSDVSDEPERERDHVRKQRLAETRPEEQGRA